MHRFFLLKIPLMAFLEVEPNTSHRTGKTSMGPPPEVEGLYRD